MPEPPNGGTRTTGRSSREASSGADSERDPSSLAEVARRSGLVLALAAGTLLLLALFILGIDILLAAFGGILFATLLRALTELLTDYTGIPEGIGLTLVIVLLFGVVGGAGWLLAPQVADEISDIGDQLPGMVEDLQELVRGVPLGELVLEQAQEAGTGEMVSGAAEDFAAALPDWFYYSLTAFFVGLFGAVNPVLYRQAFAHLFPLNNRARVLHLLEELGYTLRWWLIGQAASMVLIGTSVGLLLWAFGLPLALPMGILVGLLGFIPYLGPILAIVPVALIAATAGATQFLLVMFGYVIIQNLEGYVALPLIHQKTVYLPPAFTILSQMLLGTLIGGLGFIMATPVTVVLLVLARFHRVHALGDPDVESLGR